jgi:Metallopeptidase family M24
MVSCSAHVLTDSSCRMFLVGDVHEDTRHMVDSTKAALDAAIAICRPGVDMQEVGKTIQTFVAGIEKPGGGRYEVSEYFIGHGKCRCRPFTPWLVALHQLLHACCAVAAAASPSQRCGHLKGCACVVCSWAVLGARRCPRSVPGTILLHAGRCDLLADVCCAVPRGALVHCSKSSAQQHMQPMPVTLNAASTRSTCRMFLAPHRQHSMQA